MRFSLGWILIAGIQGVFPDLETACDEGDLDAVRTFLDTGAEITQGALIAAIERGRVVIFRELLARGGLPLISSAVRSRALWSSNIEFIKTLLDMGISVNFNTSLGSPIEYAIRFGKYKLVQELVKRGARVPSHLENEIMRPGDSAIEKELLERGEALGISDGWFNEPPLFHAILIGATDIAFKLIAESSLESLNALSPHGRTPLIAAIEKHRLGIALALLNKGVGPNRRASDGMSPLETAILSNFAPIVEPLIDHGARIHRPYLNGISPLALSIEWRHPDIASILIARGADTSILTPQQAMYSLARVNQRESFHFRKNADYIGI